VSVCLSVCLLKTPERVGRLSSTFQGRGLVVVRVGDKGWGWWRGLQESGRGHVTYIKIFGPLYLYLVYI